MIDCINAEVRDALPDLLSGKLSREDAAVLQDHIDGCADCRSELELLREVRATAAIAPPMNISEISSHLPHYAGVTPVPGRQKASVWTWKIAAAAAIITIGVFGVMRDSPSRQATALIPRAVSVVATAKPAPLAAPASAPSQGKVTEAPVKETQVASLE